ncbi:MAG: tyrosine-type recombinase/integrase [Burkholderiaceae bacterium]|nr:tyrosine-type recombinase/integrase [Burkholderiaceae bacterium]
MTRRVDRIDTVEARSKLKARRAPYWVRLTTGCSLGYRKLAPGSSGTWVARVYDPATRSETWRSLGGFEALQPAERYTAAKKAAEALAEHLERGGKADSLTVGDACKDYVKHLRAENRHGTADDAEMRFGRWVTGSKLAGIDLRKLAAHHLRDWRQTLIAAPVTVNPHAAPEDRVTRERSAASVNRDMGALRAALNLALEGGAVATDAAWRTALKAVSGADRRRTVYLDRAQRANLIEKAPADVAALLRGLSLVPLRPGALAALAVGDFDKRLRVLRIGKDKHGADRRITLPQNTADFFAELARDKLPAAPLFSRASGKPWDKDSWKKPTKAAALAAGLPGSVTAYTLRHSVITDLVALGLDVLTVARLSGTSIAMIDRHYGHLRGEKAAEALAALAV